ncbi:MAG: UDP-N-acetylglucosamine 1-carboxyvinyltransferase [Peptococcaceae bacterium]|nr:UDP-N-acetylglucosamine 1-carboxyvinyltransferase [Peptococcaceae bacterium]
MDRYVINGRTPICGVIDIHGAKNAALPIVAACLLTDQAVLLRNIPPLSDIGVMQAILHSLGVNSEWQAGELRIHPNVVNSHVIPESLMQEMRSSVIIVGPLLARYGRVSASYPGGCAIGERPIDLHIKGLCALGAKVVDEGGGCLTFSASKLRGARVHLETPSVGATENIMMAACLAEGETLIENAAREPEVLDLQNFLNALGAKVSGAGQNTIHIAGVSALKGAEYTIISDRIVAGTYLLAALMTEGRITLTSVIAEDLRPLLSRMSDMGADIAVADNAVTLSMRGRPRAVEEVRTMPHPGFPTDLQAPMLAALCLAEGKSVLTETMFESRFKHVEELKRMGAQIAVEGRKAIISGIERFSGATVRATDLRAGAALTLAGLAASGTTVVEDVYHIDRGYVALDQSLTRLGGRVVRKR